MKKKDIYRAIIAAVVSSEMEFDVMFDVLNECFSEYRLAAHFEDAEENK